MTEETTVRQPDTLLADLTPGTYIHWRDERAIQSVRIARLLHVERYQGARPMVAALVELPGGPELLRRNADHLVVVATPEDLATIEATAQHARRVAGLRALADFYEAHPDMPFSVAPDFAYCVLADTDADGLAEVRRVAGLLGVEAAINGGSANVERMFEGIKFRAFYVSRQRSADWDALMASRKAATPEPDAISLGVAAGVDRAEAVQAEADAIESKHYHEGGTAGGPGENSARCACGFTVGGYDSLREANAWLEEHIANSATADAQAGA